MKAYCYECRKYYDVEIYEKMDKITIGGTEVEVKQKHAYCPCCKEDITPEEISDENIDIANDAYRETKGSIRVADMKKLLEMYQIGASPLGKLLEWGDNTIERQMKHTMPDKEHADRLKKLFDPIEMLYLLVMNGNKLTSVAYNKALEATLAKIGTDIIEEVEINETESTTAFQTGELSRIDVGESSSELFDLYAA